MRQFRPWVTEVNRKNCDVNGLSCSLPKQAKGKNQMANLKDVDLGGQRGTTVLGSPRPGRQGTWAEAAGSCQLCPI